MTRKVWQIICSYDNTFIAEVEGPYRRGQTPPVKAYRLIGGRIRYDMPLNEGNPELVCPSKKHRGRHTPKWISVRG